jgi:hypothetical protein
MSVLLHQRFPFISQLVIFVLEYLQSIIELVPCLVKAVDLGHFQRKILLVDEFEIADLF